MTTSDQGYYWSSNLVCMFHFALCIPHYSTVVLSASDVTPWSMHITSRVICIFHGAIVGLGLEIMSQDPSPFATVQADVFGIVQGAWCKLTPLLLSIYGHE